MQCLSLVEWGYTGEETAPLGFGMYLYLYDPMARDWATSGTVYVAFADTAETFYDNSFHGLRMTRIDGSGDGRFTKWRIDDASAAYPMLSPSVRKYLVGSCTLRTKSGTDLSFPLGVEFDWSGFPRSESNTTSTLSMEKTPFQAVRAEVQPFTSDFGGMDYRASAFDMVWGWYDKTRSGNSQIDAFSIVFSLPNWVDDFGELYSVHYEYWKYRTDWIVVSGDESDYNQLINKRGVGNLGSDGEYPSDGMPDFGFAFAAPFDTDDLSVSPVEEYSGFKGYFRFYNDTYNDSGPHELRVDNPSWVFYDEGIGTGEEFQLSSDAIMDYNDEYLADGIGSGKVHSGPMTEVSSDLFYVPSYSEDALFRQYGHVDRSISRDDMLSLSFDQLARARMNQPFELDNVEDDIWIGTLLTGGLSFFDKDENQIDSSNFNGLDKNMYSYFRKAMEMTDPDNADVLFGSDIPLLDDYSPDDPVVSRIDPEFSDGLRDFVQENEGGRNLYRLTYDIGFSNSSRAVSGKTSADCLFWGGDSMGVSKTDAVFDFHFIDFTFHDGDKVYTLPAASDPFSISGNPLVPKDLESGLPTWAWILIGVVAIILALVVLSLLFPVLKPVVRGVGFLFQLAIDVVWLVLVWWWLAIVRKARGEELPPAWIWKKG